MTIKKGTLSVVIKSRKGDKSKLYLKGIVPTELCGVLVEWLCNNRNN
jgi:hypothetical protein